MSTLQCYKCDANRVDSWIDVNNLPPFMDDCPLVKVEKQCSSSIRWLSLQDLKETPVEYEGDINEEDRPRDSSLSYSFVDIKRDTHSASSRLLIYSCTTDKCNDRTSLLRSFQALTLEEDFSPLNILFDNRSTPLTEQSSCLDFSNSTNRNCPPTASFLHSCSNCFLLSMESPRQICARCPADPGKDNNMVDRQVYFFLENRTRVADTITLRCTTKVCNSLENWN